VTEPTKGGPILGVEHTAPFDAWSSSPAPWALS
jgi:hypothetical protein